MSSVRELFKARRELMRHTELGPIRATIHAPLYYFVIFRAKERFVEQLERMEADAE